MTEPRRPGLRAPGAVATLAELRLRLFLHRLRGAGGLAEAVARGIGFAVILLGGAVVGVLVGVSSWRAARAGHGMQVVASAGSLFFGLGLAWTALAITVNERDVLDLRRFLVYPVPPLRLYLAAVGGSFAADPLAAFMGLSLGGCFLGAAVARPGAWLALVAAALLLFAAATVALVTLLQELLARIARSRSFREIAIVAGLLGWLALAVVGASAKRMSVHALRSAAALRWVFFPSAFATEAMARLYGGASLSALPFLAALATSAALATWAAYRLALAAARRGGDAPERAARGGSGGSLWPEGIGPLLEKELLYLSRHPIARISTLLVPALSAFFAWRGGARISAHPDPVLRALPLFGIALYAHLGLQVFWLNAFGWDGAGARALFLAPVRPRRILAAKNAAVAAAALALFLAGTAAWIVVGGSAAPQAIVAALLLHLGAGPVLFGAGNVVSIVNPRAAAFGVQRGGAIPQLSALAGMALFTGVAACFAPPVFLAIWLDAFWIVPAGWALLAVAAWVAWYLSLVGTSRLLERRTEPLLGAVCGDDLG